jgi:hypothetical protein
MCIARQRERVAGGGDVPRQEVAQYHHRRQALPHQELDPLEYGIVLTLQIENLFPDITLACWGTSWQLQLILEFDLYNHSVLPPAVPVVRAEGAMYGVNGLLLL